jgi:lactate dehydrogenase-like 2-hydroxyacid dehydrogenase
LPVDGPLTSRPRDCSLYTWRLPSGVLEPLSAVCDLDLHHGTEPLSHDALRERVRDKQAVIAVLTNRYDDEIFAAAPQLRIVANIAVGVDNIDLA